MRSEINEIAAVCGFNCEACTLYAATQKDLRLLKAFADHLKLSVNDASCNGCRSENRCPDYEQCRIFDCAWDRGYEFCRECTDYPCAELKLKQINTANVNNEL